ncbi:hypothetical protein FRC07_013361 [Ceratobasidium sp. 392]|nr:hypothetical protein FRC07_013361 [Ceratobasidium sp. 392]
MDYTGDAIYYYTDPSMQNAQVRIGVGDDKGDLVSVNTTSDPQQPLWSRTGLGPGDHQITIRHAGATGEYAGLDYFRIESDHGFAPNTTGPAASSVPTEALFVDSTSSDLVYSGNWTTVSSDTLWTYYGGSMTMSQTPGSTITFKFTGTAVWYHATMFNLLSGTAKISVDGGPPDVINTFSHSALLQRLLWSKTDLSDEEHTVVLEHAGTESTHANLDFFRYLPSGVSPSPRPPQSQKSTVNVGAIVGGVIGGLVLGAMLMFAFVYLRRRRADPSTEPGLIGTTAESNLPTIPSNRITPFQPPTQPQWGYTEGSSSQLSESSANTPGETEEGFFGFGFDTLTAAIVL